MEGGARLFWSQVLDCDASGQDPLFKTTVQRKEQVWTSSTKVLWTKHERNNGIEIDGTSPKHNIDAHLSHSIS